MTRVRSVLLAVVVLAIATSSALPAGGEPPVPYEGPTWMPRVGLVGDSFTFMAGDVFKEELRAEWWRTAAFAFGGVRTETMRQTIREMAGDRPEAFIVQLGGNDVLPLLNDLYSWEYEQEQIAGILDDIAAAGVPCVVWAGPYEHFDGGGPIDYWTKRINDEVRAQLAARGIGVFADWTPIADAHPEYLLYFDKHLTEPGKHAYGKMLAESLRSCSRNPRGRLDAVAADVGVRVTGWTFDPDTSAPNDVHVYIDGTFAGSVTADRYRPDVAAAFSGVHAQHGFDARFAVGAGSHQVCAYAINVSYGLTNPTLGCRTVSVSGTPRGFLDTVIAGPAQLTARGWAIDPDGTAPTEVHLYVDGSFHSSALAGGVRPDLAAAFPPYGGAHGFDVAIGGLSAGTHQVCAYAINLASTPGGNPFLGCHLASVSLGADPIGAFDSVTSAPGGLRLRGWTIDPDVVDPVVVHVYIDGVGVASATSDRSRPDVGAAYPGYGDLHGFDVVVPAPPAGTHEICVHGINAPSTPGDHRLLACKKMAIA